MSWLQRLRRHVRTQPLSYRVLLSTLLWSVLVTSIATALQLGAAYRNELTQIERRLDDVEDAYLPSLEQSVWSVYTPQIMLVLEGIMRLPDIAMVRLHASGMESIVLGEAQRGDRLIRRSYPLIHDGNEALGTLEITATTRGLYQRLRERALGIAVSEAITIFLVSLFVFLLFQLWINRHLRRMAGYARELDVSRLRVPLTLERRGRRRHPDEIDELANAFNFMRERLLGDLEARNRAEAEVERHRDHLEELVAERTLELQAKTEQLQRQSADLALACDKAESALDELRTTQEQLVQSEKMASLGQLVAGVAHEVNTPLGVALTASSFLQSQTGAMRVDLDANRLGRSGLLRYSEEADSSCRLIVRNLERAAGLVHSFKQVSVDRTSDGRREFAPKAFIDELVQSLRLPFKHRPIELRFHCADNLTMDSFPGALGQVLTNLVQNAALHAFAQDDSGLIELSVEADSDNHVLFRVDDDGAGIDAEHLEKVFEPFFTTRRGQGGSGLGLHIVYNLVTQKLGGQIQVSSTPGRGTRFTIRLPRHAPE